MGASRVYMLSPMFLNIRRGIPRRWVHASLHACSMLQRTCRTVTIAEKLRRQNAKLSAPRLAGPSQPAVDVTSLWPVPKLRDDPLHSTEVALRHTHRVEGAPIHSKKEKRVDWGMTSRGKPEFHTLETVR